MASPPPCGAGTSPTGLVSECVLNQDVAFMRQNVQL